MQSVVPNPKLPDPKKMRKMVGWYDPGQLFRTACDVFISTVFGRHSDHRLIEALGSPENTINDYSHAKKEDFWIDYLSDTGDGWNSTYAIASTVATPHLHVTDPLGQLHKTKQGRILILGGDEVYPVAGRKEYEERLVAPYKTALNDQKDSPPHVFAVPGNHDWYDSLVAFNRLFISKNWFAGWKSMQERSYFAVKLPHGWWLLGTDMQLGSDIDGPQVAYFQEVAKKILPDDNIILCLAEPHWIYEKLYKKYDDEYNESNLCFLEKTLGKKANVFLAGDLHHYRRHANPEGVQKITSGGGGAFLHPTHGHNVDELEDNFQFKASFPSPAASRKLCWLNFLFLFKNFSFGVLPAFLYLLTCWTVLAPISNLTLEHTNQAIHDTINATLLSPLGCFWVFFCFVGFIFFTDTHAPLYRAVAGSLHALTHLTAAFFLGWGAAYFAVNQMNLAWGSISQLLLSAAMIFCGGWIVGSVIMGLYLFISLNIFGRHTNEAFSSICCEDWKNFLRLKIDVKGNLTIYPIGLRKVPRKWKPAKKASHHFTLCPDDSRATAPELIEPPIVVYNT